MKRLVASRKLKRKCQYCEKSFIKGDVYYKDREVIEDEGKIYAYEHLICPKCKDKELQHYIRFMKFRTNCIHPKEFVSEEWSYIPGECVRQPDHLECRLCGEWI